MKIKNTILYLAALGLFSCEMKDEIFNKNEISGDVGYLNLAVSAQNKVTKAATDEGVKPNSPVDAANFNVEIHNSEGVFKEFESYSELPEAIELPVGSYTVKAHTPGEIKAQMPSPYYNGETKLTITKDTETKADVTCTMRNTKIQLKYDPTFASIFSSWTITVSYGSDNDDDKIITYTQDDLNPAAVYWLIADEVSEIKVHINAILPNGGKVSEDRIITKPDDAESDFWAGSDALTITMEPGKPTDPENPTGVTIDVKVDVSFTDSEVTEDIPVEGGNDGGEQGGETTEPGDGEGEGGETTEPGGSDGPTISGQYLTSGISYTITANPEANESDPTSTYIMSGNPANADVNINAEAGFKEINVKITTSNSEFGDAIGLMGLNQSVNILDEGLNEMLVQVLNPPSVGDKAYALDVAAFFGMMNMYGTGTHTFDISVSDANDKEASASLTVTITLNE